MKLEHVREIANAVLYEGYLLYPYRQSALKNRSRWTFGGVYPRVYSEANGGLEPWMMRTECLLEGPEDRVSLALTLRFLHLLVRTVVPPASQKKMPTQQSIGQSSKPSFSEWGLASRLADEPLQEGTEREVSVANLILKDLLLSPHRVEIAFPATRTIEYLPGSPGTEILREQQTLSGTLTISAERLAPSVFKLSATIENTTPMAAHNTSHRDAIVFQSFISTHTILQITHGSFISLLEPPPALQTFVAACHNAHTWPVLLGNQGERDTLLSSPIILYDYPQIAPESPGPLFDGGEIDEMLSLRILTLSDEEKEQMRQDARTREILERTEGLTREQFMRMHGTIRDMPPINKGEKA